MINMEVFHKACWSNILIQLLIFMFLTYSNGFVNNNGFGGVVHRTCFFPLHSTNQHNGMSASFSPKNGVSSDTIQPNYSGNTQSSSSVESTGEKLEYFQTFADESQFSETEQQEEEQNDDYGYDEGVDKDNNGVSYISPETSNPLKSSYLGSLSAGTNTYEEEEEEDDEEEEEEEEVSNERSMYQSQDSSVVHSVDHPVGTESLLEAHPPPPPSDLNVLQAHENDVEEEGSTVLEQSVSALISESANSVVGSKSVKFYVDSLQKMQIAISSTERSLTRAAYEKEKAAERIVNIKAKAAREINEIETLMLSKLQDAQNTFVSQVRTTSIYIVLLPIFLYILTTHLMHEMILDFFFSFK